MCVCVRVRVFFSYENTNMSQHAACKKKYSLLPGFVEMLEQEMQKNDKPYFDTTAIAASKKMRNPESIEAHTIQTHACE